MTGIQPTAAIDYLRSVATTRAKVTAQTNRDMQAEWLIADLIEWQQRRIEVLTAALTRARVVVAVDRESFVQCSADPYGVLDADDQGIVDEYDAVLKMIDEALEANNG